MNTLHRNKFVNQVIRGSQARLGNVLTVGRQLITINAIRVSNISNTMYNRRPMPRMDFNGPHTRMNFNHRPPRMDFNRPPSLMNFGFPSRMDFNGPPMRMDCDNDYPMHGPYNDDYFRPPAPPMKVHCGELREHHAGLTVEISGKVHKQRLGRFLTLKDSNGMTQLIVPDDKPYLVRKVTNIPVDSFMIIFGTVSKRPKNQRNTIMSTGSVEVIIHKILNVHLNKNYKETTKSITMMQVRQSSSCANSLGVTSEEFKRCASPSMSKKFSSRTHNCGELNTQHNGQTVTLCGWIESKQGRFVQLRDGYGLVQTVVPTLNDDVYSAAVNYPPDTLVEVTGNVCLRPEAQINITMSTGHIEVQVQSLKLLASDSTDKPSETSSSTSSDVPEVTTAAINVNSFTTRTYNCGELRERHIGQAVTMCGWLEFHRVGKFVILRDGYGRTQLIIPEEKKHLQSVLDKLPYESILQVCGVVTSRPPGSEQSAMATGRIEVVVQDLQVVNRAKATLPFGLREFNKAKEPLRMQHRYLDLRFAEMQRNLRCRSRFLMDLRDFLVNRAGFVDVETPTLFRPTPGGAQEFIVPTRTPDHFYSLVQSPQQFKQMLMAGAIDRYFQVARCYRDEGARPDRQPEFTQLDIEMSFTSVEGVIALVEQMLVHAWPKYMAPVTTPFPRMGYHQAMETWGSDQPDASIPIKLIDCTEIMRTNSDLIEDSSSFDARALVFRAPYTDLSNAIKSKYNLLQSSAYSKAKLVQHKFTGKSTTEWVASIGKLLGDTVPATLVEHLNLTEECVLFLAFGGKSDVCSLLGKIRVDFVNHLEERGHELRSSNKMNFMWIVDFPLFETDDTGALASVHHPFTAPHPEDLHLLDSEPLKVRSLAYDLVLNGYEVAGGSIRIHDAERQTSILQQLNIDASSMHHLLDALASGCPPHGGVALGLDRLLAVMLGAGSIRDVIAFPKSVEGRDPLSGAPVPLAEKDRVLYHLANTKAVS